ncbi:hypothetical protein [Deinococcus multiflagellatus]|uniref:hypothetical protein n=1 Tax=Deinococcus multiflagellatus TaxID=1656887 RepID=UPI001CCAE00B|nr:hypothetical protein [Deinococcus multiflagellatus]MBZ9712160.1 hypothetical protein [Deinococcus multiflagellatus]
MRARAGGTIRPHAHSRPLGITDPKRDKGRPGAVLTVHGFPIGARVQCTNTGWVGTVLRETSAPGRVLVKVGRGQVAVLPEHLKLMPEPGQGQRE